MKKAIYIFLFSALIVSYSFTTKLEISAESILAQKYCVNHLAAKKTIKLFSKKLLDKIALSQQDHLPVSLIMVENYNSIKPPIKHYTLLFFIVHDIPALENNQYKRIKGNWPKNKPEEYKKWIDSNKSKTKT